MNDAIMAPGRRPGRSRLGARGGALLLCMAGALAAAPAAAMQVLDAVDHGELRAEVSATSVSRIALHDDRIAQVIRSPGGFETEHDPGTGDLYLRPLGTGHAGADAARGVPGGAPGGAPGDAVEDTPATAPVALFIGTEKGFTYRLTLTRAMRGSAQILIRNAAASNPVWAGKAPDGKAAGEARIGALVRLIGAVARREPLPGYAIEAPGDGGERGEAGATGRAGGVLRTVEIWRGPRFEARVVEILDLTLGGPGDETISDAAGIAARLGPGSGSGAGPGIAPGIAAAWLAGPGTGPSGGRIAVTVHERPTTVRAGASR